MFLSVTLTLTVNSFAIASGTPTSSISISGAGDITVRAEKLTRFPDSDPLNLPSFPFSRCVIVLSGLPLLCLAGGIPAISLSR